MNMMKIVRRIVNKYGTALLAVLLLCLVSAGCGGQSGQAQGGQSQESQSQEGQSRDGREDPSPGDQTQGNQPQEDDRESSLRN